MCGGPNKAAMNRLPPIGRDAGETPASLSQRCLKPRFAVGRRCAGGPNKAAMNRLHSDRTGCRRDPRFLVARGFRFDGLSPLPYLKACFALSIGRLPIGGSLAIRSSDSFAEVSLASHAPQTTALETPSMASKSYRPIQGLSWSAPLLGLAAHRIASRMAEGGSSGFGFRDSDAFVGLSGDALSQSLFRSEHRTPTNRRLFSHPFQRFIRRSLPRLPRSAGHRS